MDTIRDLLIALSTTYDQVVRMDAPQVYSG